MTELELAKAKAKSLAHHFHKSAAHHDKLATHHEAAMKAHEGAHEHHVAMAEKCSKASDADTTDPAVSSHLKEHHKAKAAFHKTMAAHHEKMHKAHTAHAEHHRQMASAHSEEPTKVAESLKAMGIELDGVIKAEDASEEDKKKKKEEEEKAAKEKEEKAAKEKKEKEKVAASTTNSGVNQGENMSEEKKEALSADALAAAVKAAVDSNGTANAELYNQFNEGLKVALKNGLNEALANPEFKKTVQEALGNMLIGELQKKALAPTEVKTFAVPRTASPIEVIKSGATPRVEGGASVPAEFRHLISMEN